MVIEEAVLNQELLSLEDAAEFLCVSKSTMYRLLDQRKLSGMKAGKQWRFRKEDLLAYMQRGPAAQALAKVPMSVLDAELAFLATELEKAGTTTDACDDPALVDEAGKITQLVRRIVWLLCTLRGSDIHLNPVWEPDGASVLLILRVDGALREIRRLPFMLHDALVLEWKRQAELPIDDHLHPLEGRAQIQFGNQLASLRVATVPTLYGEKVSVRTIPTRIPTLAVLGIDQTILTEWARKEQRGLLLFVGPTGSGKSTTRAAFMQEIIAHRSMNIMTVEDPVEYIFMQGVTHLKVSHFTPAEGMRALLRHDPDVIVVGELHNDPELAQQVVWAAETGHLVLTCMHANDPFTPLFDFLEWGIKRTHLANNLIGVVYQQLAPKLCAVCKVAMTPEPAVLDRIRQAAVEGGFPLPDDAIFYQQTGCASCGGRVAQHEFLTFTPGVRSAFLQCASIEEFTKAVRAEGQLSFFAEQVKQALAGKISLDTLLRYPPY
ncbi:MAG: GspE/PulE family protein [Armatimonadota bacterium]